MGQVLTDTNRRCAVVACVIMSIAAIAILAIFLWLYQASKENILGRWRNEVQQLSQQVSHYLKMPMDAVSFSAEVLDEMVRRQRKPEDVLRYLRNESRVYATLIAENSTGIYAYYRGQYLDGSDWEPSVDYKPKERPWYQKALEKKGEIALVRPYFNLQTKKMMMSVSKLLADQESVVSMDIFLDGVQKLVERMAENQVVRAVIVADKAGYMLAHSDASRIGVRLDEGNETDQRLMQTIKQKEGQKFTLEFDEIRISLGEPMIAGWNLMLVLDKRKLYSSLQLVYFASLAFFLFVLGSCLVGLLYVIRKNELAWQLEEEIKAAASIYMSMYRIDCVSCSMVCVRDDADLARHVGVKDHNFKQFSKRLLERFAEEGFRDLLQAFLNVETLWERLTDMETITQEFRDFEKHWVRLRFIVISRAPSSLPQRVLLALESIDEDRRRQEHLRRLSETDLMTGVLNRGCGERLVREALLQGKRGLFCLMDADNFKIINDTFGHRVGDKFLIAMADCLKKSFRDTDVVFRLGGDEFCVFVEGVNDKDSACKIVQRFFASIKKINLPELAGREVTISVGATFYPTACPDSFENMYQRADQGTYESKKLPGNQLIFH